MSKPIIGSNIGGIPELIHDGYNGFLFEPRNKESLASAIQKAEELDEPTYLEFCNNSRLFAEENFDKEQHYLSLIQIYTYLLDYQGTK
jgi:glycosyltransferase involved in cell wall biosynthesis